MTNNKKQDTTSAFSLFSKSYNAVVANWGLFALLAILPFVSLIGSNRIDNNNKEFKLPEITPNAIAALLIMTLVLASISFFIHTMTVTLQLESAKGKTPTLKQLWDSAKKYWLRLFGLYVLIFLSIIGGLILLIIPGIIMIRRYFLSPYLMIDKDLPIGEAMRRSAELSKPYSGAIWGVIGVSLLISLFSGLILYVGPYISFVLGIFYSVAPALRYFEIKKLS